MKNMKNRNFSDTLSGFFPKNEIFFKTLFRTFLHEPSHFRQHFLEKSGINYFSDFGSFLEPFYGVQRILTGFFQNSRIFEKNDQMVENEKYEKPEFF